MRPRRHLIQVQGYEIGDMHGIWSRGRIDCEEKARTAALVLPSAAATIGIRR